MSFNELNPPFGSLLISADHRNNYLATRRASFINLLQDPLFECWENTDALVPGTWRLTGAGATIARNTIVADRAVGDMAAHVTFGAATASLEQYILDPASYDQYFDGRIVTAGCFVKGSAAGTARVRISDGPDDSDSATNIGTGLEFLSVEHEINAAATEINLQLQTLAGNNKWSGSTFLFSDIKPSRFHMPNMIRTSIGFARNGGAFVGTVPPLFIPQRAFIVEHAQIVAIIAPTGAALIGDLNQWDGAAFTSMFTTRPQLAIAAQHGGAVPDGVYNRRCFVPKFGSAAPLAGQQLRAEIDQVGSTLTGSDVAIYARIKAWTRPQESFASFDMDN
ncbi:MAG: hypothetical protein ACREJ6_03335 [Candidatus Methylomirabilis sp.]